jgi:hypothetical protein
VLLGQHGADQADQRVAVGKDADHVGAPADLAVEPLGGVVRPDLPPDLLEEGGEGEHVGPGGLQVLGDLGQLVGQRIQDAVELRVHGVGVRLVVDRVQQRPHPRPGRLWGRRHQVGRIVGATSLPGGAGQGGADGVDQAAVGISGDQGDPGQAAGGQVPEEAQPAGAVLGGADLQAEDLPVPVGVHPGREQGVHVDHPPALAAFRTRASAATNVYGP